MARRTRSTTILAALGFLALMGFVLLRSGSNDSRNAVAEADGDMYVKKEEAKEIIALVDNMAKRISNLQSEIDSLSKQQHEEGQAQHDREAIQRAESRKHAQAVPAPAPAPAPAPVKQSQVIDRPIARRQPNSNSQKLFASNEMCQVKGFSATVDMESLYDQNPFQNPTGGGGWTQGWDVQVSAGRWASEKLNVFIVPHSHNDPGWIKTLDEYYRQQTSKILTLMVNSLTNNPDFKFVWAEMSYLSIWWDEQGQDMRNKLKTLVESGRMEIVTGGWVMPDEANSHYFALVDQLIEGHEWLRSTLGAKPKSGWSIDPFGQSPTMAYILKRAGLSGMVIQRVHYEVKRMLAREKQLEFRWVQDWDDEGSTSMYTHLMPFYSYDGPHSCGPDPKVCCQFDFARLAGLKYSCPWRVPPVEISSSNVAHRANMLLEQYRKKAELYGTNNIMVPLGDDFRYDDQREIDAQLRNYRQLINYFNSHPELNANVKFATLGEYFNAVHASHKVTPGEEMQQLPSLTGDFFSYADRNDNYWTGYFTSRPFHKHLDRELESHLRAAEILFSGAQARAHDVSQYTSLLSQARRALGVFQHHDGITGTAKDHVVIDYGIRMLKGLQGSLNTMRGILKSLLFSSQATFELLPLDERSDQGALPSPRTHALVQPWHVIYFNSVSYQRRQLVSVIVDTSQVKVLNADGESIRSQAMPLYTQGRLEDNRFRIWFEVDIPAFGAVVYTVKKADDMIQTFDAPKHELSTISGLGAVGGMETTPLETGTIVVQGTHYSVEFEGSASAKSGHLRSITHVASNKKLHVSASFQTYHGRRGEDKSGAYLFMPREGAAPIASKPSVVVFRGPLVTEVVVQYPEIVSCVRVLHTQGMSAAKLDIENTVDVRQRDDQDFIMRFESGINNDEQYFTDLNGFHMRHRKYYKKIPTNGNYYPMTSRSFLQDDELRLTLNTRSAVAVASLQSGWLEVMMDRRHLRDDNRGLGQGIKDNLRTTLHFSLMLEPRQGGGGVASDPKIAFPSRLGLVATDELDHPMLGFSTPRADDQLVESSLSLVEADLGCDVHVLNYRSTASALILHRRHYDCRYAGVKAEDMCPVSAETIKISEFIPSVKSVKQTSLSLMHDLKTLSNAEVTLPKNELSTLELTF